jgi:hypothetical protein
VSAFSAWSTCSASCGDTGVQSRSRSIVSAQSDGGYACPYLAETRRCNSNCCPVNCRVDRFSSWSLCSASCGAGVRQKTRAILAPEACGGTCEAFQRIVQTCSEGACPQDCIYGNWTNATQCTKSCGTGQSTEFRDLVPPLNGGRPCVNGTQRVVSCNADPCAESCQTGGWSSWTPCSKSCGNGTQSQTRDITFNATYGGEQCGPLSQSRRCNEQACGAHCVVSAFSAWSTCTTSCGSNGAQSRSRSVVSGAADGGYECPYLEETRSCNLAGCHADCEHTNWTAWTTCTTSCGAEGSQTRNRSIVVTPRMGGETCGALNETQACNRHPCKEHCVVSAFSAWSTCSVSCGDNGGVQSGSVRLV